MTLFAFAAELSLVPIVFSVTRDAGHRQLVAIEIAHMARVALDRRMRASQHVLGIFVVIEVNRRPPALAMATLAPDTVTAQVNILDPVATVTRRADPAVAFAAVASGTGNGTVRLVQRKLCGAVVEGLDVAPVGFAVALFARVSQAPLVRIDRFVTIGATPGRIAKFCGRCVATAASHR